jgi:hypothetical protein
MRTFRRIWPWLIAAAALVLTGPARAADADKYLPDDTEAVVTVNVPQLLAAPLLQANIDKFKQALKASEEAQKTLQALGFDPLKDVERATLAVGSRDAEKFLLIIRGRFDPAKFQAKAEEVVKQRGDTLKVHPVGGGTVYETNVPGQTNMFVAVLDGTTLVASPGKEPVADALDKKAGKKQPAPKKALLDLIARADSRQTISVAVVGGSKGLEKVESVTGGLAVADDIRLDLTVATKDADSAKEVSGQITTGLTSAQAFVALLANGQRELAPLVGLLGTIKTTADGSRVSVKGQVTREDIEKVIKKVQ